MRGLGCKIELEQFFKIRKKLEFFVGVHGVLFELGEEVGPEGLSEHGVSVITFLELVFEGLELG